jgi:hypothetical protein
MQHARRQRLFFPAVFLRLSGYYTEQSDYHTSHSIRCPLLLAVAQPAIDRAEHVGIIVGPDPLLRVGLGQRPLV